MDTKRPRPNERTRPRVTPDDKLLLGQLGKDASDLRRRQRASSVEYNLAPHDLVIRCIQRRRFAFQCLPRLALGKVCLLLLGRAHHATRGKDLAGLKRAEVFGARFGSLTGSVMAPKNMDWVDGQAQNAKKLLPPLVGAQISTVATNRQTTRAQESVTCLAHALGKRHDAGNVLCWAGVNAGRSLAAGSVVNLVCVFHIGSNPANATTGGKRKTQKNHSASNLRLTSAAATA